MGEENIALAALALTAAAVEPPAIRPNGWGWSHSLVSMSCKSDGF
jgi:hypothetical protein